MSYFWRFSLVTHLVTLILIWKYTLKEPNIFLRYFISISYIFNEKRHRNEKRRNEKRHRQILSTKEIIFRKEREQLNGGTKIILLKSTEYSKPLFYGLFLNMCKYEKSLLNCSSPLYITNRYYFLKCKKNICQNCQIRICRYTRKLLV